MERYTPAEREYYERVQAIIVKTEKINQEAQTLDLKNLSLVPFNAIPSEEATIVREINKIYLIKHKKKDLSDFDLLLEQGCADKFVQFSEKGESHRYTWHNLPFPLYTAPPNFDFLLEQLCTNVGFPEDWLERSQIQFPKGFLVKNNRIVCAFLYGIHDTSNKLICPRSIGNLSALRALCLLGGDSTYSPSVIPAEIGNLAYLTYFDAKGIHLTQLPEGFDRLKNLKALNLSYNKHLITLPESFGVLSVLEGLELQFNNITALPISFVNLDRLQKLNLMGNALESLPPSFDQLINLRYLQLKMNRLSSLPDFSNQFQNIEYLNIEDNPLRSLYGISSTVFYQIMNQTSLTKIAGKFNLSAHGRNLLEAENWEELEAYYRASVQELAYKVVHGENLSQLEEERLLHEATPEIRNLLETHLPRDHPYLTALYERWQVSLSDTQRIIL